MVNGMNHAVHTTGLNGSACAPFNYAQGQCAKSNCHHLRRMERISKEKTPDTLRVRSGQALVGRYAFEVNEER
jgi:hypothetical protein